jgi:hypothetical protein
MFAEKLPDTFIYPARKSEDWVTGETLTKDMFSSCRGVELRVSEC